MAVRGYDLKRSHEFENTRAICFYSIMPYVEKKDRVPMEEFWPLPTDRKIDKAVENDQLLNLINEITTTYGSR